MFVRDIMNQCAVVCTEDMSLEKVYKLMQENTCDHVIVVENYAHRTPIGIITEHDICLQVVGRGRNPRGLSAANVMNTNITRALATLTLTDCILLMQEAEAKQAFVVDENGTLHGTVTNYDIESTKTKQHIEDLLSRAVSKTHRAAASPNRIF
jgi:CBS domain-containing protein